MKTITLVACVGGKHFGQHRAEELYDSVWFSKARKYAIQLGPPWYIISAKYGLLPIDNLVEPYEVTLNTMPKAERESWARLVTVQITSLVDKPQHIVFLAGDKYRNPLADYLRTEGISSEVPMDGLPIGKQLEWLDKNTKQDDPFFL